MLFYKSPRDFLKIFIIFQIITVKVNSYNLSFSIPHSHGEVTYSAWESMPKAKLNARKLLLVDLQVRCKSEHARIFSCNYAFIILRKRTQSELNHLA